ncbi:hypothetical protein [Chitinivorax sp. B]|uniref:hypothetical protein n=1 Tax=Chitinivorax sp. B TaxID=2502235 RepID=UPI0010F66E86|nr:hypothetical protein [Chitinivorax sp. B]
MARYQQNVIQYRYLAILTVSILLAVDPFALNLIKQMTSKSLMMALARHSLFLAWVEIGAK